MSDTSDTDPAPKKRPIRKTARHSPPEPAASGPSATPVAVRSARPARGDRLILPFFVCLLVGSAMALAGHFEGWEAVGLFGPIVMTAAYPIWGVVQGFDRQASLRERFADNAYYLGFIFTQIALLIGFGLPALMSQSISSSDVLRYFGVAIGASMVGLIARTLLVQTGHSITETADLVQDEVEALAVQVEGLARGVTRRTQGMLSDLDGVAADLAAARGRMGAELAGLMDAVGQSFRAYGGRVDSQAEAMEAATDRVGAAADQAGASITRQHDALVQRLGDLSQALGALERRLDTRIGEASETIGAAAQSISQGSEAVNRLQGEMSGHLSDASAGIRSTAESLGRSVSALQGLSELNRLVGSLDERVGRLGQGLDTLGRTVNDAATKADSAGADAANQVYLAIDAARARAQSRAETFAQDIDSSVAALEVVLSDFRKELERVNV